MFKEAVECDLSDWDRQQKQTKSGTNQWIRLVRLYILIYMQHQYIWNKTKPRPDKQTHTCILKMLLPTTGDTPKIPARSTNSEEMRWKSYSFKTTRSYPYHMPGSQRRNTWLRCLETCRCECSPQKPTSCHSTAPRSGGSAPNRSPWESTYTHTHTGGHKEKSLCQQH